MALEHEDNEIQINSFQFALFLKNLYISPQPLEFASRLNQALPFLDGSPTILPIPQDAPVMVPRILLGSQSKQYSCNVSSIRFDLFVNNMNHVKTLENLQEDFIPKINLLVQFLQKEELQINRIGFITNMQFKTPEGVTSAEYIRDNFMKNISINKPREVVLKFIYRDKISSIDSNISIQMNQKGSGLKLQEDLVLLQTDINTIPDLMAKKVFSPDEIANFVTELLSIVKSKKENFPKV